MSLHPMQDDDGIRLTDVSFVAAVDEYGPALTRYCQRLTGDRWDAEDLLQDTLMKALVASRRSRQPMCRSFLYRIANNAWIDKCRRRKETVTLDDQPQTEERVDPLEVRDALISLLRQLPPRQQVAVLLKDVFGLQLEEIAANLGTSQGAVKALLHRARETLDRHRTDESSWGNNALLTVDENVIAACLAALNRQDPQAFIDQLARIHLQAHAPLHLLHQSRVQARSHGSTVSLQARFGVAA